MTLMSPKSKDLIYSSNEDSDLYTIIKSLNFVCCDFKDSIDLLKKSLKSFSLFVLISKSAYSLYVYIGGGWRKFESTP